MGHVKGSYEDMLKRLFIWLRISEGRSKRSLLGAGTVPLPECAVDWMLGVAGPSGVAWRFNRSRAIAPRLLPKDTSE